MNYLNPIYSLFAQSIYKHLLLAFPEQSALIEKDFSAKTIGPWLSTPPQKEMGDIAFPCFQLAKTFKLAPPVVAQKIFDHFTENKIIDHLKTAGPFLNAFLNWPAVAQTALPQITQENYLRKEWFNLYSSTEQSKHEKIMFEYSQPNTHKELHVGHMRNVSLGLSLVNLYRFI